MTQIMDDYPWALAALGFLGVLGAGYGAYRFKSRAKAAGTETSFLESRLQPDSFFGASGGQRIDTREASGQSSSISYSLSQLDAIGDVDPVAEADVYLAYGRDLQAEEILKEAMRTNPNRLAIRTKLLEVYNKRRDTKGFELLAAQLYSLTKGTGEDWARVQELGLQIDPENFMYKPGGRPSSVALGADGVLISERLNATTQPQSTVAMSPTHFPMMEPVGGAGQGTSVDLDLDMAPAKKSANALGPKPSATSVAETSASASQAGAAAASMASTAPVKAAGIAAAAGAGVAGIAAAATTSFANRLPPSLTSSSLSSLAVPTGDASAASTTMSMAFDLDELDLDLPKGARSALGPVTTSAADAMFAKSESGPIGLGMPSSFESGDPLMRKIELAEEFRQIGDLDGARDLLQEVIAKGGGEVKARAQGMLDRLA
jgi:pilus assembly protein FimV